MILDISTKVICLIIAINITLAAKWRGRQPSTKMATALSIFLTLFSWYLVGEFFGVYLHWIPGNGGSQDHVIRLLYLSILPFLYMIYLVLAGKAAARD